ncbi:Glutathione S-transferase 3 [Merluccius polli]|uniref:glutathione transferase n=1 Tax=Merluccius polli TaxID=89951 RepID=A0AA47M510_MERPO|nr:Glutathione S-transferase 3 [Merluccius polli]
MSGKVVLYYFNGRGRMESVRWLLAAAEVEFDEVLLTSRDQYEKLLADGVLMYEQVPMVEMDGMHLVQTKAILKYIAEKYNLNGKDIKERAMVNMYSEGLIDLMEMIMILPFTPPADVKTKLQTIETKATGRYLPVFEKAVSGSIFLVGGQLSCADVQLMECSLMLEEKFPGILAQFPNIKGRMSKKPAIERFLQPGSQRKPQPDDVYVKTVMEVLNMKFYSNGRGRMESVRWLLAAAEVEVGGFDEVLLTSRDQYEKLVADGVLMYEQVPMVEMDGMHLVQTKAILKYIAEKYNLNGKDIKERAMVNMYSEGLIDLMEMIMILPFTPPADVKTKLQTIETKATGRYLPVFEKAVSGSIFLVGGQLSCADVQLMECSLMLEEKFPGILAQFPNIKGRMSKKPAIERFLQPGSQRKPQPDDVYVKTVKEVFNIKV